MRTYSKKCPKCSKRTIARRSMLEALRALKRHHHGKVTTPVRQKPMTELFKVLA